MITGAITGATTETITGAVIGLLAGAAVILWTGVPRIPDRAFAGVAKQNSLRHPFNFGFVVAAGITSVAAGGLVGSPVAAALAPAVILVGGAGLQVETRSRQRRERLRTLPLVVDLLAQVLRSGSTTLGALQSLSTDHRRAIGATDLVAEVAAGTPLIEALKDARRMPPLLRAALLAVARSGTSGAGAIERLADQLRLQAASEASARAQSGQQLASASLMAGIPPVIALLYGLSDATAAQFYLHRAGGAVVLFLSFALSGLSWFWMRWILVGRAAS